MTPEGALPSSHTDDWMHAFICRWQPYVLQCSIKYCWSKQNAEDVSHTVFCEVLELLKYVDLLDTAFRRDGVDRAIAFISESRIPCVEPRLTENHRADSASGNNQRQRQLKSAAILRENARRERLSKAYSLLTSVSNEYGHVSRAQALLIAILATKYFKEPVEKTFFQHFTRNECTKANRRKENRWVSINYDPLDKADASNQSEQAKLAKLAIVRDAISALSENDQELLKLEIAGKSREEVAEFLCVSDEAFRKRLSRAIERLRDQLEKKGLKHE
jgi:RNA polymerase sigma factor (sigma-70 family)